MTVLSRRALNRALLARNLLLERHEMALEDAIEHLVGAQAQEPHEPYVAMFSRLYAFDPWELSRLLETRRVVRTARMRRTLHLVTARDCIGLRPMHQTMLHKRMRATLGRRLTGVDDGQLAAAGRPHFEGQPMSLTEAGRAVQDLWPAVSPRDLGDAMSSLIPLVQVPPRGLWQQTGAARNTTIRVWLGRDVEDPAPEPDSLVLRYLTAFGPAASADIRAWSGLSGIRAVLDRLRPQLRSFRDERGRELLDVEGGLLPEPDIPAPPRFLPAFDNAVLAYDDRSRIIADVHRGLSVIGARFVLADGRVAATWDVSRDEDAATLLITPLGELDVEMQGTFPNAKFVQRTPGRSTTMGRLTAIIRSAPSAAGLSAARCSVDRLGFNDYCAGIFFTATFRDLSSRDSGRLPAGRRRRAGSSCSSPLPSDPVSSASSL